jgi:hypothetical protein
MAKPTKSDTLKEHYTELVKLSDILPYNVGLSSPKQSTMISVLGAPQLPLTTVDQPNKASAAVKKLKKSAQIFPHLAVTGISPAVDSLVKILQAAAQSELNNGHDLASVLSTAGMLNVRYRKPTDGSVSTAISNHAWGTAVDLEIHGYSPPGNTHDHVPRFIAVLVPFFNDAGWYSGIAFHDTMHFEVSNEMILDWAKTGKLK